MTSLPPPFISLPNIHNLRPLVALELPHHQSPSSLPGPIATLRPKVIWRSADPYRADPAKLRELGIRFVFDLRSVPEIQRAEGGLGWAETGEDGIERVWTPIFEESDYSPERLAKRFLLYMGEGEDGFPQAYSEILHAAGPAYARILRAILAPSSPPNMGFLIHCSAGKDRTGIIIALLLSFLGATDEAVAEEYNLTEIGLVELRPIFMERILNGVRENKNNQAAVEKFGEEGIKAGVYRSTGARKESMLWTLGIVRQTWGGAGQYFKEVCGLSGEEIEQLRSKLVIGGAEKAKLG